MGILSSILKSGLPSAVGKIAAGYGIYKTANYVADRVDDQAIPGYSIGPAYGAIARGIGTIAGGGLAARGAAQVLGAGLTGIGMAITDKELLQKNINDVTSKYTKESQRLTKDIDRQQFLRSRDLRQARLLREREAKYGYVKNKKQRVKQNRTRFHNLKYIEKLEKRAASRASSMGRMAKKRGLARSLGAQAVSQGKLAMTGDHYAMTGFGAGNIFTRAGSAVSGFSPFGLMGKGAAFVGKSVGAAMWGVAKAPVTVASDIFRLGRNVSGEYRAANTMFSFADHGFHMTTANPLHSMGSRMAGWGAIAGAGELALRAANEVDPTANIALMGQQEYDPSSGRGPRRMREDPSYFSTVGLVQAMHTNR